MAFITLKAIGNTEQAQSSSQLVVVGCSLLVDMLKALNLVLCFLKLFKETGHLLTYSGGKPIGYSVDCGTEGWVEGNEHLS